MYSASMISSAAPSPTVAYNDETTRMRMGYTYPDENNQDRRSEVWITFHGTKYKSNTHEVSPRSSLHDGPGYEDGLLNASNFAFETRIPELRYIKPQRWQGQVYPLWKAKFGAVQSTDTKEIVRRKLKEENQKRKADHDSQNPNKKTKVTTIANDIASDTDEKDDTVYMNANALFERFYEFDKTLSKNAYERVGLCLQYRDSLTKPPPIALLRQLHENGKDFARHDPAKVWTDPAWVKFLETHAPDSMSARDTYLAWRADIDKWREDLARMLKKYSE
ncbi:uncharacterized protein K460DRAFT_418658 [Cucurbitaria berberidis CBS 394.84]|uniref:Uncharacterized protein n=1 Tax=Cucurbitaria berberidis CBS 394.84 TaxID=1168544 RepID=A0A9P4GE33_9PLEO|nr:uncharacterized protein K460DRAFT_418658 [Cucurbitaria berberidis CBS 394.84]KAF1843626.1 hypothetical protein K460DRAFT_418658 [Cucurbitaria berberidis CBS 394.84]